MRAFLSIDPPPDLLAAMQRLQARLRTKMPDAVRWSNARQLHLTLLFLGEVADSRVPELSKLLAAAVQAHPRLQWQLNTSGCFPNLKKPNVLWLGAQPAPEALLQLQAALKQAAQPFVEREENRPFHPRVTLGRMRPNASTGAARRIGEELQALVLPELPSWPVDSIRLMQSQLKPHGAEHSVVAEFRLQP